MAKPKKNIIFDKHKIQNNHLQFVLRLVYKIYIFTLNNVETINVHLILTGKSKCL
jgi:hypothetical protein